MNKRKIMQSCLSSISIAIILDLFQRDFSLSLKSIIAIPLLVVNFVYNYCMGIKDGKEISKSHNERMNELRKQSFDKIVDMVVEEKEKDKAAE